MIIFDFGLSIVNVIVNFTILQNVLCLLVTIVLIIRVTSNLIYNNEYC